MRTYTGRFDRERILPALTESRRQRDAGVAMRHDQRVEEFDQGVALWLGQPLQGREPLSQP